MPKQTRYGPRGGPAEKRRPRSTAGPGLPLIPLLALVALIGLAVVAARLYSTSEAQEESTQTPQHVPFAGLPEEQPPGRGGRDGTTRASTTDRAPSGLEADPTWQQALEVAARGDEALARSNAARARGDSAASQDAAREARAAFDEALTLSGSWEDELVAQYGETDRQVRRIRRTRDEWLAKLTALRRTTGR